jgi:hypothetical protein
MGLTDVPRELFCMKNVTRLWLSHGFLCSLPSEISLMTTLEELYVRGSSARSFS